MATDQTPPPNRLIATIAILSVLGFVALRFALGPYFTATVEREQRAKQSAPAEYAGVRAEQQTELVSGPMPIDRAMAEVASGRARELIAPRQSGDVTALTGWLKAPKPLPKFPPRPAAALEAFDGGALDGALPDDAALEGADAAAGATGDAAAPADVDGGH